MSTYRDYLKSGLASYFDIEEDYVLGKDDFEMFASFNQRNAKYMLLKNVEIYAFTNNEYILHKKLHRSFELDDLKWLKSFLDDNLSEMVTYDSEHMSSVVTVIFECPLPHPEIQRKINRFKYYKSFMFGLKGWVNAKVMVIDPAMKRGITNKLARGDLNKFIMN